MIPILLQEAFKDDSVKKTHNNNAKQKNEYTNKLRKYILFEKYVNNFCIYYQLCYSTKIEFIGDFN